MRHRRPRHAPRHPDPDDCVDRLLARGEALAERAINLPLDAAECALDTADAVMRAPVRALDWLLGP